MAIHRCFAVVGAATAVLLLIAPMYLAAPASNVTLSSKTWSRALPQALRVGAFNIKTFGVSKMSDSFIAGIIRDIVARYDVLLIQEIRDISGSALQQLLDMLGRSKFGMTVSERLGRSSYKEEYAFFYRLSTVQLVATHQYDDGPDDYSDEFEREPYCVRFRPIGSSYDIAMVGIHAKPDAAVEEIASLLDVYDDVTKTWPTVENVIIMGDFNAACSYASERDLQSLPIYTLPLFSWPIGFDADTTTSANTNCAYDRFIMVGSDIQNGVVPGTVGIYQFENTHKLSYDVMLDVSDHYPIEMLLS